MAKKSKGGLIEDRVIRNPMEQMRRKLKFKAKQERKELRLFARQLKDEQTKPAQMDDKSNVSLKMAMANERSSSEESENDERQARRRQPYELKGNAETRMQQEVI